MPRTRSSKPPAKKRRISKHKDPRNSQAPADTIFLTDFGGEIHDTIEVNFYDDFFVDEPEEAVIVQALDKCVEDVRVDEENDGEEVCEDVEDVVDVDALVLGNTIVTVDADAIARFTLIFTHFVDFLVNWCRESKFNIFGFLSHREVPICFSAMVLLMHSEPSVLARNLLAFFPNTVKSVLGRTDLSVSDLLMLPIIEPNCRDGGCYLSIAAKRVEGFEATTYTAASLLGQQHEVGIYVGSTSDKAGGFSVRLSNHKKEIAKRKKGFATDRSSCAKFYGFAGRPDVCSSFFLLASMPTRNHNPASSPRSFLIEALFQAFLSLSRMQTESANGTDPPSQS